MTVASRKKTIHDDPEYGVDSRYASAKERDNDSISLMEARLERIRKLPKDQVLRAKLMQLKLKMEDYLKQPVSDPQNHFAYFLKTYADIVYSKRNEFAKDINVTPVFLSKVINNHREPQEEFILKLMIHSEKVFKHFGDFNKNIWYQIYFHEKLCDIMSSQSEWRPDIEKKVKITESIVRHIIHGK